MAVAFGGNNTTGPVDVATACNAHGESGRLDFESETFIAHSLRASGFDASEDGTGMGTPIVPVLECGKRCGTRNCSRDGIGIGEPGDPMFTLQAGAQHGVPIAISDDTTPKTQADIAFTLNTTSPSGGGHPQAVAIDLQNTRTGSDVAGTLDTTRPSRGGGQAVAFAQNTRDEVRLVNGDGQIVGALAAESGMKQTNYVAFQSSQSGVRQVETHATLDANNGSRRHNGVVQGYSVRRLTPREAERLQGFPDDYTLIPHRNKPAADGPRYRALGNSMAVPCMSWIGRRIQQVDQIAKEPT